MKCFSSSSCSELASSAAGLKKCSTALYVPSLADRGIEESAAGEQALLLLAMASVSPLGIWALKKQL